MYQLSPSILAADFACLGKEIKEVEEAGAKWLHLDVMDGKFVPCVSFGMPVITSLRKVSNLFFDVHLMIEEPERYIKEFKEAGADMLTVHAEACRHLDRVLHEIHNAGMKAGIALNAPDIVHQLGIGQIGLGNHFGPQGISGHEYGLGKIFRRAADVRGKSRHRSSNNSR